MLESVLIWGAGGHARVVADIIRLEGRYRIAGFLDDVSRERDETQFCQAPLFLGSEALDALFGEGVRRIILAFGDCEARLQRAQIARERGFLLITAVHPGAVIAPDARVGEGTIVAPGAVVAPAVILGENVIINTCASVDHESVVEDGAHVSVGVRLGGRVRVGRAAFVGMGTTVLPNVQIGEGALVGAGAVVVNDIPARTVAYGVPARVKSEIGSNE
ncbi:MAG: acetyltransferase [Gemmatimonadetes bacterium]|nr:acetyltransferase [Gemmatimonadota bacterium]